MTKCYFYFCKNIATKKVVTSIRPRFDAQDAYQGVEEIYNPVCDMHIRTINWHESISGKAIDIEEKLDEDNEKKEEKKI